MDPILQVLLSWQFILFGLAVAAIMYVIRTIVDYFIGLKTNPKEIKLWNELFLPILPVLLGAFGADFFSAFPYPDGLTTKGDRIIFGLVAGLFSTLMYRVIKALLFQKIQGVAQAVGVTVPVTTTTTTTVPAAPVVSGDVVPSDQISSRGQL